MSYIGNVPKYSEHTPNYFDGDGSTTTFVMDDSVASNGAILVFIDGIKQLANTYNVNGANLIFTEAPPAGTKIEVNFLGIKGRENFYTATTGGGENRIFFLNDQVITENYTIPAGQNAGTFGPVTIEDGTTVTVPDNCTWSIV